MIRPLSEIRASAQPLVAGRLVEGKYDVLAAESRVLGDGFELGVDLIRLLGVRLVQPSRVGIVGSTSP